MKPETAYELLTKYVKGETLLRHCKTVGVAMKYFAEKYGEDPEYWESVGILHDIDFEVKPESHCIECVNIFNSEKANYPEITDDIIHAVQSHGFGICNDVEPVHKMEKVLFTVDELTGLIFACAMARPSKSVMDMELKSVTKKFKDKAFAAGCSRDVIRKGAEMMGVELNEIIQDCILAMRTKHEEIGC